jgi:hypothetical protein
MDTLTNKTYKSYDYTCRYTSVPYFYSTVDDKYIYGIGTQLNKDITYVAHKLKDTDTLDSLALEYYNNPTFYWIIAYFNDIEDVFEPLLDILDIIKIPTITSISFGKER